MPTLAQKLIAEEVRVGGLPANVGRAAFRVCEKMRVPLGASMGNVGFRSLLRRAHNLAKNDAPWLAKIRVADDGSFAFSAELEAELDSAAGAEGGAALVSEFLELLSTFIGEALTLRQVHAVWPKSAFRDFKPAGK